MALAVVLLIVAAFGIAIMGRPAVIVSFAIGIFSFEQWAQANSAFFATNASFLNLVMGGLTLWALAVVALRGQNPLNPMRPSMAVFWVLFAYNFASCFWSINQQLSLELFKYYLPYMVCVSILMPLVFRRQRDMGDALTIAMVFGMVISILLFVGTRVHAWGRTIEAASNVVDRFGQRESRLSPLAVADMAGQLFIIAMLLNHTGKRKIWKTLRWVVALMAMLLIVRSGSRGQFIAAFFTVVVCVTFARGTKNIVSYLAAGISIGLVGVMAVIGYFTALEGQFGKRWDLNAMQNNFSSTRGGYVSMLFTYWAESSPMNWMFGLGSSASFDPRIIGTYCHVVPIEILAEMGFAGLFMMALFMGLVTRDGFRLYMLSKDSEEDRGVAVALLGLFLFQLILTLKQASYLSHTTTWMFAMMISRHAAVMEEATDSKRLNEMKRRWFAFQSWQFRNQRALGS